MELTSKEKGNCNNVTLERKVLKVEVIWQQSSRTSTWSLWLSPQRFIEFGSYLEPRVPFLTYALDFSSYTLDFSPYALNPSSSTPRWQGIYIQAEKIFRLGICRLFTYRGMRLDYLWASPSGEEWLFGWTQLNFLPYIVVSFAISIGQGVLTRWQRSDTSKAKVDGTRLWGLPKTIGPNVCICLEWFWNDWKLGKVGLPWSSR